MSETRGWAVAAALLVLSACGSQAPELSEIEGEHFANVRELVNRLDCREQVTTFGYPPVGTETSAARRGNEVIGNGQVQKAVDAGGVWLLVNSEDRVFGGIGKIPGTVFYCTNQ